MSTYRIRARQARGTPGDLRIERDPDRLASYLQDAAHVPGGHAAALVMPRNEAEVAAILRGSDPVLPIGAQSSLTGGATPMGELLLSTARMTAFDVRERSITAEPGVTLAELDQALQPSGSWYPPVPTFAGATVGGVVSTNAAGAATFKHGATRQWVEALTVVLAGGDVLDLGRGDVVAHPDGYFEVERTDGTIRVELPEYRMPDVVKVAAGYYAAPGMDLIDLFVGAEGTLGVVTSVTLRTQPRRPSIALALIGCRSRSAGLEVVARLRAAAQRTWSERDRRGIDVGGVEHLDRRCLELLHADGVDRACGVTMPDDTELALLVALEVPAGLDRGRAYDEIARALDASAPDTPLARFCRMIAAAGLLDRTELAMPADRARHVQLLAFREAVPAAVNARIRRAQRTVHPAIQKVAADVSVPFARLEELFDRFDEELRRRQLDGAVWGHLSDGNLHPNIIPRTVQELADGMDAVLAVGRQAIALGGSPCAEHGVGRNRVKQQLVRELYGDTGIAAMRRVKRALDPDGLLAPGVLGL